MERFHLQVQLLSGDHRIHSAKRLVRTQLISLLAEKPLAGAGKGKGLCKRLPGN